MPSLFIVSVLSFLSATFLVFFGYLFYGVDRVSKKRINSRLASLDQINLVEQSVSVIRPERRIENLRWVRLPWIQKTLLQSGFRIEVRHILGTVCLYSIVIAIFLWFCFGKLLLTVPAACILGLLGFFLQLRIMRSRRIEKFGDQLPEALDIIVRSLRVGHPLPNSLALVAREIADPLGGEFHIVSNEVAYGLDVPAAVRNLRNRVEDPNLTFVLVSVSLQTQVGGDLSEVYSKLSRLIRERCELRRKVHALSAEGRISAIALSCSPMLLFVALRFLAPNFFGDVWDHPVFQTFIAGGVVWLAIGNFMVWRMINFRY